MNIWVCYILGSCRRQRILEHVSRHDISRGTWQTLDEIDFNAAGVTSRSVVSYPSLPAKNFSQIHETRLVGILAFFVDIL